jgi:hypothetical protein
MRQKTVALSSTKSEYMALTHAMKKVICFFTGFSSSFSVSYTYYLTIKVRNFYLIITCSSINHPLTVFVSWYEEVSLFFISFTYLVLTSTLLGYSLLTDAVFT